MIYSKKYKKRFKQYYYDIIKRKKLRVKNAYNKAVLYYFKYLIYKYQISLSFLYKSDPKNCIFCSKSVFGQL